MPATIFNAFFPVSSKRYHTVESDVSVSFFVVVFKHFKPLFFCSSVDYAHWRYFSLTVIHAEFEKLLCVAQRESDSSFCGPPSDFFAEDMVGRAKENFSS